MSIRTDNTRTRNVEEINRQRQLEQARQKAAEVVKTSANAASKIGENNLFGVVRKDIAQRNNAPMGIKPTEPKPPNPLTAALTPYEATQQIKQIPVPDPKNAAALDGYIKQTQQIAQTSIAAAQPPKREVFKGLPPQLANMEYRDSLQAYNQTTAELKPYAAGISYARYDKTVDYMFGQMKGNLNTPEFKFIKGNLDLVANPPLFSDPNASLGYLTAAMTKFALQEKTNGPWDHKPILKDMLGLVTNGSQNQPLDQSFPIRGDVQHEVNYDIWSNIHYGYVGRAAGFDQGTLQTAAGLKIPGLTGGNDPVDVATTQIGIDLWNKYGANMTKQQFESEVQSSIPKIIAAQQTQEYKDINGDFHHVTDINQTNRR